MIHSMTAYARREIKGEWGTGTWEVRSVNQRYLETFIRAPEQFRGMEPVIRERLRKHLQRGKVEVFLKFVANPAHVGELSINQSLAEQLINSAVFTLSISISCASITPGQRKISTGLMSPLLCCCTHLALLINCSASD